MEQITKARNNKDRQRTYREQLGRYKKAMNNEFYFEALLIVYSLLEDRLKSFLYYCGFFANRNTLSLCGKTKEDIKMIMYGDKIPDRMPTFNNITTKIAFMRRVLEWADEVRTEDISDNLYLVSLKKQLEGVDIGGLLDTLSQLDEKDTGWLGYRNEIMHASMNKNIEAIYARLSERIEEGMDYARYIDSQVRILRDKGIVRKRMGLQNN